MTWNSSVRSFLSELLDRPAAALILVGTASIRLALPASESQKQQVHIGYTAEHDCYTQSASSESCFTQNGLFRLHCRLCGRKVSVKARAAFEMGGNCASVEALLSRRPLREPLDAAFIIPFLSESKAKLEAKLQCNTAAFSCTVLCTEVLPIYTVMWTSWRDRV